VYISVEYGGPGDKYSQRKKSVSTSSRGYKEEGEKKRRRKDHRSVSLSRHIYVRFGYYAVKPE